MVDYTPYLRVTKDRYIWWRLEDAIRLGAGFHPFADDHAVLATELRASNNRATANERTLIGAFSDDRLNIERPMTIERDGSHFVDASAFLTWLSQYIAQTQAKIAFPNDLVREVRNAKAEAASSRIATTNKEFESLTLALEAWFDQPRDALPDKLSYRVQQEFLVPWDALKPTLRRDVALRWDYQNDPATQEDRRFWWDFCQRMDAIEQQIREWEASSAPTASDLAQKETRLKELREELARMDLRQRQPGNDYYPARTSPDETKEAPAADAGSKVTYIPYPRAMKILAKQLGATPEEMAAWVLDEHIGGGLDAFLNANELNRPPKFDYSQCYENDDDDCDYHSPLMACWFKEDEIAQFEPANRYMTGKTLIERWSQYPEIQPHAYIYAKINESRLMGRHPIMGLVLGARRNSGRPSPLETALFALADVEDVEAEDFGVDETPRLQSCDVPKKASRPDQKLNQEIEGGACEVFRAMENLDASELTITFVGDKSDGLGANNMLEITARKETRRIALAALALVDRRGGSANSQGVILLGMALKKKLTYTGANAAKMKRLRDMFRSHLGISGDPFEPYHQGAGWVPRFMIADKRGAADERARREAERRTDSYEQLNERGDRFADSSPTDRLLDADDADDWLKDNDPDAAA